MADYIMTYPGVDPDRMGVLGICGGGGYTLNAAKSDKRPGVDPDRMGVLGICGGGGYTLNAAKSDKRFKAVATLSMFNTGEVRRNGYMNSGLDTVQQRLHEASDARAVEITQGAYPISVYVDFDALSD